MKNLDEKDLEVLLSAINTLRDMIVTEDKKDEYNKKLEATFKAEHYGTYTELEGRPLRGYRFFDELFMK